MSISIGDGNGEEYDMIKSTDLQVKYTLNPDLVILSMGPNNISLDINEAINLHGDLGNALQDMSIEIAKEQK